jgi:CHAT domain-containing protein/Tfp pilus assembly protein PilF
MKKLTVIITILLFAILPVLGQFENLEEKKLEDLDSLLQIAQSKRNFKQAISITEVILNKLDENQDSIKGSYLFTQGLCYFRIGATKKAAASWENSYAILKASVGEIHPKTVRSLNAVGIIYRDLGKVQESEAIQLRNKEIRAEIYGTDHPEYAKALGNLANLYEELGRHEEAEAMFLGAKGIWEKTIGKETYDYAGVTNNLGILYFYNKEYSKCQKLWTESLEIREKVFGKDHPEYATIIDNLANLYSNLGDIETADKYYKEAIRIFSNLYGPTHSETLMRKSNLGQLYRKEKRYKEALALFKEIIEAREKDGTKDNYNLIKLAGTYEDLGDSAALRKVYTQVLQNYAKDNRIDFDISTDWGKNIVTTQLTRMAKESLEDALIFLHSDLKNLYEGKVLLEKRYLLQKYALNMIKSWRNEQFGDSDKLRIAKMYIGWLSEFNITSAKLYEMSNDPNYLKEALIYTDENKSALLSESVSSAYAYNFGEVPDSLLEQEKKLTAYITKLQARTLQTKKNAEDENLSVSLSEAQEELRKLKTEITQNYPKYSKLKYTDQGMDLDALQGMQVKDGLLLEYFIAKNGWVYCFVVDQKQIELVKLELKAPVLDSLVENLRSSLVDYSGIVNDKLANYKLYTSSAYACYATLLEPLLAERKNIKSLTIVTDGALGHIPFEAFLTEPLAAEVSKNTKPNYIVLPYLLNNYAINYSYSAELLTSLKPSLSKEGHYAQMLAYAPTYEGRNSSNRSISPYLRNLREGLSALPAAQKEVKGLQQYFEGVFLLGENANEANFKQTAETYGVLHLAMHGLLNEKNPILSSLAFTENGDSTQDNFLQAYEISQMQLNAQLVVLSACETGYGKFQQGEGVMSLARSFMYAGAPSLLVSLWQVNDASTSLVMQSFYKHLAKGMTKSAALRQAKLDYINAVKDPMVAHPAFWSPFILIGDESPVEIQRKGGGTLVWWGIGAGCLVLVITIVFVLRAYKKRQ